MPMNNQKNLELLKNDFLKVCTDSFGSGLKSLTVYGSMAGDTYDYKTSDINLLIIIDKPDREKELLFAQKAWKLMRRLKITPLLLTLEDFLNSADVFPLEYMDIKNRHITIYGEDVTGKLVIEKKHLRHELEEKLRGSSISLSQALSASGGKKWLLKTFLSGWYRQLSGFLRGLQKLGKTAGPESGKELTDKLENFFAGTVYKNFASGEIFKINAFEMAQEAFKLNEELKGIIRILNDEKY
jgi:predicted nucleotidyltransferase